MMHLMAPPADLIMLFTPRRNRASDDGAFVIRVWQEKSELFNWRRLNGGPGNTVIERGGRPTRMGGGD